MDQKSMYEAQSSGSSAYAVTGRDTFILEYLNAAFAGREKLRIAELSIGGGTLSSALVAAMPSAEFTFADISSSNLKALSGELGSSSGPGGKSHRFVECNFDTQFELFESDSYDVVIALDILEHVFDVFGFISNCRRVLRRGGSLILRAPNIAYVKHRVKLLFGGLPVTASWFGEAGNLAEWKRFWGWDGGHLHLFTIPVLTRLLSEEGFGVKQCRDPGTKWEPLRDICPNLMYSNPVFIANKN